MPPTVEVKVLLTLPSVRFSPFQSMAPFSYQSFNQTRPLAKKAWSPVLSSGPPAIQIGAGTLATIRAKPSGSPL